MEFLGWVNVAMAAGGTLAIGAGVGLLTVSRPERPDPRRRAGLYAVCLGLFFLLQVAGYLGRELGLFGNLGRGLLVLLSFAAGATALIRYRAARPQAPPDRHRAPFG